MTENMKVLLTSLIASAKMDLVSLKVRLNEYLDLLEELKDEEITGPTDFPREGCECKPCEEARDKRTVPCGCGLGDPCEEHPNEPVEETDKELEDHGFVMCECWNCKYIQNRPPCKR